MRHVPPLQGTATSVRVMGEVMGEDKRSSVRVDPAMEAMGAPVEDMGDPVVAMVDPMVAMGDPMVAMVVVGVFQTVDMDRTVMLEDMEGPMEAMEDPVEAMEDPVEDMEAPVEAMEAPVEAMVMVEVFQIADVDRTVMLVLHLVSTMVNSIHTTLALVVATHLVNPAWPAFLVEGTKDKQEQPRILSVLESETLKYVGNSIVV